MPLLLSVSALRTEFADFWNWLAAVEAELRFRPGCSSRLWRPRPAQLRIPQQAGAAFFRASIIAWPIATPAPSPAPTPAAPPPSFAAAMGMALRHLVLRITSHVADHIHADPLIEDLLQLVRE